VARFAVRTLSADLHRETGIAEEREGTGIRTGPTIRVKDGRFEVPALFPGDAYRAFVLDEANKRAATFLLEGKHPGDKPLTVKWQACGSATARVVGDDRKPAGQYPVVIWVTEALQAGKPAAGAMRTGAPFTDVVVADKEGKITLENLISGVRYLLLQPDGKEVKEFTVEPGQKRELGDVVVDPAK
jgi:hypothetical protein